MNNNLATALFAALIVALSSAALGQQPSTSPQLIETLNRGAALAGSLNCAGCHGAGLRGGSIGGSLDGIERRRSRAQIESAFSRPPAPMPAFALSQQQLADVAGYLSNLDGGLDGSAPVVSWEPALPTDHATISVAFLHGPPAAATVQVLMHMGSFTHGSGEIPLTRSADPKVLKASVPFTMGGPWVLVIRFEGERLELPLQVGGS